jgi:hypothetical protein
MERPKARSQTRPSAHFSFVGTKSGQSDHRGAHKKYNLYLSPSLPTRYIYPWPPEGERMSSLREASSVSQQRKSEVPVRFFGALVKDLTTEDEKSIVGSA